MYPLTSQQERKTQKDCGTRRGHHFTSSSSTFDQPSSSHLNDDDDDVGNDEGTSHASTPSLTHFDNLLTNMVPQVFQNPPNIDPNMEPFYTFQTKIINRQVQLRDEHRDGLSDEDVTTTPSPITTSFSPSPPNTPSKTLSTKDTSSTFGTAYSSFESKPQSSPLTSNDTPSPQPSNPFHENVMDAPPRPSHLLLLQSHPFLDITFSLSPITPLDHILDTPSLPSPQPQPKPPLMRHPFTSTIVTTMDQLVFVVFTTAILSFLLGMR
nr:hypothetical protein [Tanacetum cinerariifolium]